MRSIPEPIDGQLTAIQVVKTPLALNPAIFELTFIPPFDRRGASLPVDLPLNELPSIAIPILGCQSALPSDHISLSNRIIKHLSFVLLAIGVEQFNFQSIVVAVHHGINYHLEGEFAVCPVELLQTLFPLTMGHQTLLSEQPGTCSTEVVLVELALVFNLFGHHVQSALALHRGVLESAFVEETAFLVEETCSLGDILEGEYLGIGEGFAGQ